MLLLWLTARVRDRFLGIRQDDLTERRLQQGRDRPVSPNVLDRAWTLAQCPDEASSGSDCPRPENRQKCQLDSVVQDLLAYNGLRNPYVLRAALGASTCSVELARDAPSGRVWALVPGPSEVELVPLRTGPTVRAKSALAERQRLRASVALGLSTVRIERAP
jgi:hypothetical protein